MKTLMFHRGHIEVASSEGAGTTFIGRIPERPQTRVSREARARGPSSSSALLLAILAFILAVAGCGHAPPVTGNRAPGAGPDPDYPEINCAVNNTVDCRPPAD